MTKRLKNLVIDRVDLVDKGANYDDESGEGSYILLAKRDAPPGKESDTMSDSMVFQKVNTGQVGDTAFEPIFKAANEGRLLDQQQAWAALETLVDATWQRERNFRAVTKQGITAELLGSREGAEFYSWFQGLPAGEREVVKYAPPPQPGGEIVQKIETMAAQLRATPAGRNLSPQAAFVRILELRPELYLQYLSVTD